MKKFFISTVLFAGLFFSAVSLASANQLLVNGDFLNGINSWTDPHFGSGFTSSNIIFHNAAYSATSTVADITGSDYSELSQTFSASSGQIYYATGYVKTNISVLSTTAKAGIQIQFYQGSNPIGAPVKSEIGGQTDWRLLYISATAPASTTSVKFFIYKYAADGDQNAIGGTTYFDDCVLSTTFIAPPAKTTLYNPGFENGLNDWADLFGFPATLSTSIQRSGSLAASKTIGVISGQDYYSQIYQLMDYTAGQDVYATVYAKSSFPSPSTTAKAGLKIEFLNAGGGVVKAVASTEIGGATDWKQLYVSDTTHPSGATKVRISGYIFCSLAQSGNGGTAYFDDFVFSNSFIPPPALQTTLLNSGFESGIANWLDLYGFPSKISTTTKHIGTSALQKTIGVLTPPQNYFSETYQDIYFNSSGTPISTITPVYATAYAKTVIDPTTKSNGGLQIEFFDGAGTKLGASSTSIGGNTDWRYLYVTGQAPVNSVKVRLSGTQFARQQDAAKLGDAYYDDFQYSLTPLTLPTLQYTLFNANFENGLNDWKELNSPGEVSTNPVHGGLYSAVFDANNLFVQDYYGTASQDIKVSAGYPDINASVWVKTVITPDYPASAKMTLDFFDYNDQPTGVSLISSSIGGMTDWTQVSISGTIPSDAYTVRMTLSLFAPKVISLPQDHRAYFDDAALSITKSGGGKKHILQY